jgi:hypothetical protein
VYSEQRRAKDGRRSKSGGRRSASSHAYQIQVELRPERRRTFLFSASAASARASAASIFCPRTTNRYTSAPIVRFGGFIADLLDLVLERQRCDSSGRKWWRSSSTRSRRYPWAAAAGRAVSGLTMIALVYAFVRSRQRVACESICELVVGTGMNNGRRGLWIALGGGGSVQARQQPGR